MNSKMIEYANKITSDNLIALFNNEIKVLSIKDYYEYSNGDEICERINNCAKISYTYEENVVSHIGNSSYEIDLNENAFEAYYRNVEKNYTTLDGIFRPKLPPHIYFNNDLKSIWAPGVTLEEMHEKKKMFAGILRIIHKGSAIHAHHDLIISSNPKALNGHEVLAQVGMNYFLQTPKEGGELLVWDQQLGADEFIKKARGDFCIPIEEMPLPDLKLKPEKGMLELVNTSNLHAINTSVDLDRIAFSYFIAYRGRYKPLTFWS